MGEAAEPWAGPGLRCALRTGFLLAGPMPCLPCSGAPQGSGSLLGGPGALPDFGVGRWAKFHGNEFSKSLYLPLKYQHTHADIKWRASDQILLFPIQLSAVGFS